MPIGGLKHKNFTALKFMDLVAGKSAKHEIEAETARFSDQEHTKPHPSLLLEVECKSAEIKKIF